MVVSFEIWLINSGNSVQSELYTPSTHHIFLVHNPGTLHDTVRHTTMGYQYVSLTKLTEPVRYGMEVINKSLPAPGYIYKGKPVPRVVGVNIKYISHRTVGYCTGNIPS